MTVLRLAALVTLAATLMTAAEGAKGHHGWCVAWAVAGSAAWLWLVATVRGERAA